MSSLPETEYLSNNSGQFVFYRGKKAQYGTLGGNCER